VRRLTILARIALVRIGFGIGGRLPQRRQVVLATSLNRIGGNLAAIRDELVRRDGSAPVVTLVHDPRPGVGGRLRAALHALQAGYHLARARIFVVDSHYAPVYVIRPRAGTTIVQTWHASGAIKRIGYGVLDRSFGVDETTAGLVRLHANYSLCLAASRSSAAQFVEAFRQPMELFETRVGLPATDVLFGERAERAAGEVRRRYAVPDGRRVILYAPTFRGQSMIAARHPGELDLPLLARTLGQDHVLLLRMHPAVRRRPRLAPGLATFVIDVSDHPEANELLPVADVLVTDYSSIAFDFALLGRPIAFFAPDHAAYERERGFFFDYRSGVPGPVFETTMELAAYLRAGSFDTERVRRFAAEWFEVADGHAAERFATQVVAPALAGRSQ
jgi:CDP-ribitol ribitolphosphotransferase